MAIDLMAEIGGIFGGDKGDDNSKAIALSLGALQDELGGDSEGFDLAMKELRKVQQQNQNVASILKIVSGGL